MAVLPENLTNGKEKFFKPYKQKVLSSSKNNKKRKHFKV